MPLAERQPLKDQVQEVASQWNDRKCEMQSLLIVRIAERNINLTNQHSHEDHINEKQNNQLTERRAIEKNIERKYLKI